MKNKNFINLNSNDNFSRMSKSELSNILNDINNYYLELRNSININKDITFGIELECEYAHIFKINKALKELNLSDSWKMEFDSSLFFGTEIVSPILIDNKKNWNDLKNICEILRENAVIGKNSGGHIHIGAQSLGTNMKNWLNFIRLWSVYENIIFRFSYGEYLTARRGVDVFAFPSSSIFYRSYKRFKNFNENNIELLLYSITLSRCQSVNFCNVYNINGIEEKNTIEFRCPNGSLDPVIWQNNVNLFSKIIEYSKNKNFNNDIINEREKIMLSSKYDLLFYDNINIDQAVEFADLIFNNNEDKIYFLRQYFKSFETSHEKLTKAKTFTKK